MKSLAQLGQIDRENRIGEFAGLARALMLGKGDAQNAEAFARSPRVAEILKAGVTPGGVVGGDWGNELLAARLVLGGFSDSLRHASAFAAAMDAGLIVRIPLGDSVGMVYAGAIPASETPAAAPIGVRKLDVANANVTRRKAAGVVALSVELLRAAPGEAESIIGRELRAAVAVQVDAAFIATLLDGVTEYRSSGSPLTDAANLLSVVRPTPMSRPFWVAGVSAAIRLSTAHSGSTRYAPDAGPTGGSLLGIPLFVTDAGVALDDTLLLCDGARIAGNIGEAELSRSRESLVESTDAPTGGVAGSPAAVTPLGATARLSLWQENLEATKVVQYFGVAKLRSSAVAAVFTGGSPA